LKSPSNLCLKVSKCWPILKSHTKIRDTCSVK